MRDQGRDDMNAAVMDLTDRQAEVLRAIYAHMGRHGIVPTVRQLAAVLGISSPNGVISHLKALEAKGYLAPRERLAGVGIGGNNSPRMHTIRLRGVKMVPAIEDTRAGRRLAEALGVAGEGVGDGE